MGKVELRVKNVTRTIAIGLSISKAATTEMEVAALLNRFAGQLV